MIYCFKGLKLYMYESTIKFNANPLTILLATSLAAYIGHYSDHGFCLSGVHSNVETSVVSKVHVLEVKMA